MEIRIIRWASKHGVESIPLGHCHNDTLQFIYQYGLPGVASVVITVAMVLPKITLGDPWSAAWVAGAILSLASIPFHNVSTGLIWLTATAYLVSR